MQGSTYGIYEAVDAMSVDLCGISGDIQYWHNVAQDVALWCLCGNELVYSGFDAVDVPCGGSSCKPSESIPKKGE